MRRVPQQGKLGDLAIRLDRIELEHNEATPGDPGDTTTPEAMMSIGTALFWEMRSPNRRGNE